MLATTIGRTFDPRDIAACIKHLTGVSNNGWCHDCTAEYIFAATEGYVQVLEYVEKHYSPLDVVSYLNPQLSQIHGSMLGMNMMRIKLTETGAALVTLYAI